VAYHWGGSRDARGGIHYRRVGSDDGRRVAAGAKTLAKYGLEMNRQGRDEDMVEAGMEVIHVLVW